tara:strand:+ start:7533 stop:8372 length:840 start_codon:yes stop_codon:yes gene_type:complete
MANIKQKYIKPGRDYNYSEGVKVLATAAVAADQIVYVDGSSGPFLKVSPADCDAAFPAGPHSRLMIAKHAIAAGAYGIVLPWKLVTTVATTGKAVGDAVYLSATAGTTTGANLATACPTSVLTGNQVQVIVGRVTIVGAAGTGAILVNAASPEVREPAGSVTITNANAAGRRMETLVCKPNAATTARNFTFDYPITIVDVYTISDGSGSRNAEVYKGSSGTNKVCGDITFSTSDNTIARATTIDIGNSYHKIPTGTALRIVKSAAGQAGDLVIVHFIRG